MSLLRKPQQPKSLVILRQSFAPNKTGTGGKIDPSGCGYKFRKNKARGQVLEWEHVVPAAFFGQHRICWRKGHAKCVKADGTAFKGRACCVRVDRTFRRIEADLHNLAPAVGEFNGDRSNLPYGLVAGEVRQYGACNFEIGGKPRVTEPREEVRGDAARVWLYMSGTYNIKLTAAQRAMFQVWSQADPVDSWELLRDTRIEAVQGNKNPFVR
ncbi:MAG TPA: endonuclease [Burkholderiales bacterium]|nr:endonuclease [Burkholderiales bacterium]